MTSMSRRRPHAWSWSIAAALYVSPGPEHDALAVLRVSARQLGDAGRLAHAVHADDQQHQRSLARLERVVIRRRGQDIHHLLFERPPAPRRPPRRGREAGPPSGTRLMIRSVRATPTSAEMSSSSSSSQRSSSRRDRRSSEAMRPNHDSRLLATACSVLALVRRFRNLSIDVGRRGVEAGVRAPCS